MSPRLPIRIAALLALFGTAACRASAPAHEGDTPSTSTPELVTTRDPTGPWVPPADGESWWTRVDPCPPGARLQGAAPPTGMRVWCETPAGSHEGPASSFYDDGVRRSDAMYRDGRMHGAWRQFHPDGRVRSEGEYIEGREVGLWRSYHPGGEIASEAKHGNDGTIAFVAFSAKGAKEREGTYVDGREHGTWTAWDEHGKPHVLVYEHGKVVSADGKSPEIIGIAACDEYIEKFTRCIQAKVPEAARTQMMEAMKQSVAAWKEAAASPAKDALEPACKAALDAAKQATAAMGCEW